MAKRTRVVNTIISDLKKKRYKKTEGISTQLKGVLLYEVNRKDLAKRAKVSEHTVSNVLSALCELHCLRFHLRQTDGVMYRCGVRKFIPMLSVEKDLKLLGDSVPKRASEGQVFDLVLKLAIQVKLLAKIYKLPSHPTLRELKKRLEKDVNVNMKKVQSLVKRNPKISQQIAESKRVILIIKNLEAFGVKLSEKKKASKRSYDDALPSLRVSNVSLKYTYSSNQQNLGKKILLFIQKYQFLQKHNRNFPKNVKKKKKSFRLESPIVETPKQEVVSQLRQSLRLMYGIFRNSSVSYSRQSYTRFTKLILDIAQGYQLDTWYIVKTLVARYRYEHPRGKSLPAYSWFATMECQGWVWEIADAGTKLQTVFEEDPELPELFEDFKREFYEEFRHVLSIDFDSISQHLTLLNDWRLFRMYDDYCVLRPRFEHAAHLYMERQSYVRAQLEHLENLFNKYGRFFLDALYGPEADQRAIAWVKKNNPFDKISKEDEQELEEYFKTEEGGE